LLRTAISGSRLASLESRHPTQINQILPTPRFEKFLILCAPLYPKYGHAFGMGRR
jgi:hypothetical protein